MMQHRICVSLPATSCPFSDCSAPRPRVDSILTMRRVSGPLFTLAPLLLLAGPLLCPPLAAQRRPGTIPFPDDDVGLSPSHGHSFTISGSVSDAESHARIAGVRVDLQALSGGTLASEFTGSNG